MFTRETLKAIAENMVRQARLCPEMDLPIISFDGVQDSRGEYFNLNALPSCIQLKDTSTIADIAHEVAHWYQQRTLGETHCASTINRGEYPRANTLQIAKAHRKLTQEILKR